MLLDAWSTCWLRVTYVRLSRSMAPGFGATGLLPGHAVTGNTAQMCPLLQRARMSGDIRRMDANVVNGDTDEPSGSRYVGVIIQ